MATVNTSNNPDNTRVYIGLAHTTFKDRYRNHKKAFNNPEYKHDTSLSTFIWSEKQKAKTPTITWKIIKQAAPYNNISKKCRLCLEEKLAIISYTNSNQLLNKRNELVSKCRHQNNFLLKYYDKDKSKTQS